MLIIAVGNVYRTDDGAGIELAGRIRAQHFPGVGVVEAIGDVSLLELWRGQDNVIVVDGVRSGEPPGTIVRRDVSAAPVPREWFHLSSHQVGIADSFELARALGTLPRHLVFVGIEAESFEPGVGLSPVVEQALGGAIAQVRAEMRAMGVAGVLKL